MRNLKHTQTMPDTGDRREIARFANAKETETVRESKKLLSKTRQQSTKAVQENRSRGQRKVSSGNEKKPHEAEEKRLDREASAKMVDEGDPNPAPPSK